MKETLSWALKCLSAVSHPRGTTLRSQQVGQGWLKVFTVNRERKGHACAKQRCSQLKGLKNYVTSLGQQGPCKPLAFL